MGPAGPAGAVLYLDGGVVALPSSALNPQLIGYTTFTTNGAIGGRLQANAYCAGQYPGTHLCTGAEFRFARPNVLMPAGSTGAWVDYGNTSEPTDPYDSSYCANFTSASVNSNGLAALPTGYLGNPNCGTVLPLACCTSPTRRLRGYTTFTSNGAIGGRLQANAYCAAQYAGSHLCTGAEFRFSRPSVLMPAGVTGAWVDYGNTSDPKDPYDSSYCANFTSASVNSNGLAALPTGYLGNPNCGTVLPLACCD
jgi:hypothetical protein